MKSAFVVRRLALASALSMVALAGACSGTKVGDEDTGAANLEIINVPSDVNCIRVTAEGGVTVQTLVDVTPGQPADIDLSGQPIGVVAFSADAFPSICAVVTPMTTPTWVSNKVTVNLTPGVPADISLTLYENGIAGFGVDFSAGGGCHTATQPCLADTDCCSGVCYPNKTCAGNCSPNGSACMAAAECCAGQCSNNVCCVPQGNACATGADCCSGSCNGGVCGGSTDGGVGGGDGGDGGAGPLCSDGMQNGSETDIDCGGLCAPCAPGNACQTGADCQSGACNFGVCTLPLDVCGDGQVTGFEQCDDGNVSKNDGCDGACVLEPGFICFGQPSICISICGDGIVAGGEQCDDANTSSGDGCDATCMVEPSSCVDGVKNGAETDNDCGGPACGPCAVGKQCVIGGDCQSNFCVGGVCQAQMLQPNGALCVMGSQCNSGNCVDGVCCNTACTGTCFACTTAKTDGAPDGACAAIMGGTDPDNECPGAQVCSGMGFCL